MPKVLIIEDDVIYCDLVQRILVCQGFEVQCAHTLNDGRKKIAESDPDAVILDLALPDSPTDSTVLSVKACTNKAIIVLSGNPWAAEESLRNSAFGFINKNHDLKYVATEIRNAIKSFDKVSTIRQAITSLK